MEGVADDRQAHDGGVVLAREPLQHVRGAAEARELVPQTRELTEGIEH
jgi:hypothetical protein